MVTWMVNHYFVRAESADPVVMPAGTSFKIGGAVVQDRILVGENPYFPSRTVGSAGAHSINLGWGLSFLALTERADTFIMFPGRDLEVLGTEAAAYSHQDPSPMHWIVSEFSHYHRLVFLRR